MTSVESFTEIRGFTSLVTPANELDISANDASAAGANRDVKVAFPAAAEDADPSTVEVSVPASTESVVLVVALRFYISAPDDHSADPDWDARLESPAAAEDADPSCVGPSISI